MRVKLDAALDFLKGLKGQDVEVSLSSLAVTCDALRAGEQTINISVDPDRAAALIAKSKSIARRGRRRLDHRRRGDGPHHPVFGRRLARRRQAQQGQARRGDRQRAGQNACGEIVVVGMERQYRKAEIDVQAAEPDIPRARPHRDGRGDRPGGAGQARRVRPADAVDRQSRIYHGGRRPRAPSSIWPTNPAATRKASQRTTTARSMRWPRNSRASAGTRINRPGNNRHCRARQERANSCAV